MKIKKVSVGSVILLICLIICILSAGCISTDKNTSTTMNASDEKVLVVADMWQITSINPEDGHHGGGAIVLDKVSVLETLVGSNSNSELVPLLATSWSMVNDTCWEFKIRNDVTFHNGDKMTSYDVKTSLDGIARISPAIKSLMLYDHIEVVDDYTIRVYTTKPNPLLPNILRIPDTGIISHKSYELDKFKPICTGAMKVESFNRLISELVVVKNTNWWGGSPSLDKIIVKSCTNSNIRDMKIEKGEVDFISDPTFHDIMRFNNMSGIRVETYPSPRLYALYVNLNRDSMSDLNVRKAIAHAIDQKAIVDNILCGTGTVTSGVFSTYAKWSNKSLVPYKYDLELSKKCLEEAGWVIDNADGLAKKDGKPLQVKIYTYTERPGLQEMQEYICSSLRLIGIEVVPVIADYETLESKRQEGDWDLYLYFSHSGAILDPAYQLKMRYGSSGEENFAGYSNPEIDDLIEKAYYTQNLSERYQLSKQIESIIYADLPSINIATGQSVFVMKDTVSGYKFDPTVHDYCINPFMSINN
ncbi:MAG TPA: ABC transporter substrate-binding protein [Methanocorpusculum sp.]|nr:ABC transporter substrate-binding protein [Methanocorpusculum sp.]